jgi:hypothetical protein
MGISIGDSRSNDLATYKWKDRLAVSAITFVEDDHEGPTAERVLVKRPVGADSGRSPPPNPVIASAEKTEFPSRRSAASYQESVTCPSKQSIRSGGLFALELVSCRKAANDSEISHELQLVIRRRSEHVAVPSILLKSRNNR